MRSAPLLFAIGAVASIACSTKDRNGPADSSAGTAASAGPAPRAAEGADALTAGVNTDSLAERLVAQSAGVREGDLVLVFGGPQDQRLLEDLAVQTRRRGAFPLIASGSDRLTRRLYVDVPAKYDAQPDKWDLRLRGLMDAAIVVDENESAKVLDGVPPERIAARAKASQEAQALGMRRGVRVVSLGNDLTPTAERAQRFGMSREDLAKLFWAGVNVDYPGMQARGDSIRAAVVAGRELRITNPNGTDLRVGIAGRPVYVSDGMISDEDRQRGGSAVQVWLPAGEVYLTPVEGSAQGTLVADRHFFRDKEVRGLRLTIKDGRVTDMAAQSGLEPLKAQYDASGPGRDAVAFVDLGMNPNVRIPPGSRMVAWMPAGMVTVGIGNNVWAGGQNRADFGASFYLPGSTVTVDGRKLVDAGVLQVPARATVSASR